jgi:hypothetical protein
MGVFQICSSDRFIDKEVNNKLKEVRNRELLNENKILYNSSIRYDNIITKILLIQTENIENFFYTNDLFQIKTKSNKEKEKEKKEEEENINKLYYSNIHVSNYLGNKDYIIIFMQCVIKNNIIKKPNFSIFAFDIISNEKKEIIEQLDFALNQMLEKKKMLNSIIQLSNNQYYAIYENEIENNEIEYKIEFYESYLNSIKKEEIEEIMERHKEEEFICSFIYKDNDKIGNNYIFIFYIEKNNINLNSKKDLLLIKREQISPDIFIKNITNNCGKKGIINSIIDSINESFILFNGN